MTVSPPTPPDQLDRQAASRLPYIPPPDKQFGTIPPPPPPSPYPGYMSPQDLAALAAKTIADAYAPQLAYLQQQQQRAQQMAQAQQSGLAELYKIIAGSYSGLGSQIAGIYDKGASDLGNLPSDIQTNDVPVSQQIVSSGAAAGPGYGSAYPELAGQQGQVEFLKAVQEGNAQQADFTDQIQRLMAEEPGKVQQVLSDLQGQQADYAKTNQPTYHTVGGDLIAIDANGVPHVVYKGAASGKVSIRSLANGQLQAFGPDGRPVGKPYGPVKTETQHGHYTPTAGGDVIDTYTGKVVGKVTVKPTAPGKPTYWTDGAGNRHMTTGQGADVIIVPHGATSTKPPTAATLAKARGVLSMTKAPYWAAQTDPNTPLTSAGIRGLLSAYNKANGTAYTLGQLGKVGKDGKPLIPAGVEDAIGIGQYTLDPQSAYLKMVQLGIPARRAWQMVRSRFPSWGKGYFPGKADAAATGGNSDVSYKASEIKTPDMARQAGLAMAAADYGWQNEEAQALDHLWTSESGWDWKIKNKAGSGATGIPQALPASKMASAGADWRTNPLTQIKWGLGYIKAVYGTPSRAWAFWQATVNKNPNLVPPDLRAKALQWIHLGYTGY